MVGTILTGSVRHQEEQSCITGDPDLPFAALVDPILPLEGVDDGFAALTSGYPPGRDVIKVALRGGAG